MLAVCHQVMMQLGKFFELFWTVPLRHITKFPKYKEKLSSM